MFYQETTERKEVRYSSKGGGGGHWVQVSNTAYGVFFVTDATGTSLAAPAAGTPDLVRPETTDSDELPLGGGMAGATRRTERLIAAEAVVTVLGTPRPLGEFMKYLRQNAGGVPPDLVAKLVELEQGPGSGLPCFFGRGIEKVADQPYGDFVSGSESSASSLLWAGGALTLAGAGALLYAMDIFNRGTAL